MLSSKTFKKYTFLALTLGLCLSACQKESLNEIASNNPNEAPNVLSDYPEQITIKNWEQFVNAPAEVLEYHYQRGMSKEQLEIAAMSNARSTDIEDQALMMVNRVRAFSTSFGWATFPGIKTSVVSSSGSTTCSSFSFFNPSGGANYTINCSGPRLRMEGIGVNVLNGLVPPSGSNPDLQAIVNHILGTASLADARQYIAADAYRDGIINIFDLVAISRVQLGMDTSFPNSPNVVFLPEGDFADLEAIVSTRAPSQLELVLYGGYPNTTSIQLTDRRMIKTGDVDGSLTIL